MDPLKDNVLMKYLNLVLIDLYDCSDWFMTEVGLGRNGSILHVHGDLHLDDRGKEIILHLCVAAGLIWVWAVLYLLMAATQRMIALIAGTIDEETKLKRAVFNVTESMRILIDKQNREFERLSNEKSKLLQTVEVMEEELDRILTVVEKTNPVLAASTGIARNGGHVNRSSSRQGSVAPPSGSGLRRDSSTYSDAPPRRKLSEDHSLRHAMPSMHPSDSMNSAIMRNSSILLRESSNDKTSEYTGIRGFLQRIINTLPTDEANHPLVGHFPAPN